MTENVVVLARQVLDIAMSQNVDLGTVLDTLRRDARVRLVAPLKEEARLLATAHPFSAEEIYLAWTPERRREEEALRAAELETAAER